MDDTITLLERQYCPPIDPSLLHALISDYDVSNASTLSDLRSLLESLKQSAEDGHHPMDHGLPHPAAANDDLESETARSLPAHSVQSSAETDSTELTGVSLALEGLHMPGASGSDEVQAGANSEWDTLSTEQRREVLHEMFPNMKSLDITSVLRSTGGNYGRAVEELLNRGFLEDDVDETGAKTLTRGIDGFTEPVGRARRKGKGRKIAQRRTSSTPAPSDDRSTTNSPSPLSRWDRAKEDIDFISIRTHIQRPTIASLYHKQGASLAATIAAICDPNLTELLHVPDAPASLLRMQADELAVDFPNLKTAQTEALVTVTSPATAAAHELARVLAYSPDVASSTQITPSYRPRSPSRATTPPTPPPTTLNFPSHTTEQLGYTRTQAYNQASAAYHVSKSKPLMAGAAAYYSSVARDTSTAIRQREAVEADSLVAAQSLRGQIDLHGVSAKDAVRITKQRVEQWWDKEGREWAREGKVRNGGLFIITGRGQHSQGGKGKLGPAVGRMLIREGWKVEIGEGVIDVVGRNRSRM